MSFSKFPSTIVNDAGDLPDSPTDWINPTNVSAEDANFANALAYDYTGVAPP